MTPEERARVTIDDLLRHAGWDVQDRQAMNLFDRTNLGLQAENEFRQFQTPEGRKFGETYNIRHLTNNVIDVRRDVNRVHISTVQRLYAMLKDEELDEAVSMYEYYERMGDAVGVGAVREPPCNP